MERRPIPCRLHPSSQRRAWSLSPTLIAILSAASTAPILQASSRFGSAKVLCPSHAQRFISERQGDVVGMGGDGRTGMATEALEAARALHRLTLCTKE